jgi:transcriptional regulator GlxA family with amidase domain
MRVGGKGVAALLFCCSVEFEGPAFGPLLPLLPEVLSLQSASDSETLPLLLQCIAQEVEADRIGLATVLSRLADVVVMQFVRSWVEGLDESRGGWIAAIRDPRIGKVLAAMHSRPGDPWTIESLAQIANLSRSGFSQRFAQLVGCAPAHYLTKWRMNVAMVWLRRDRVGVVEIARRLGYDSEQSFSRAFRRIVGQSPSSVRAAARPA